MSGRPAGRSDLVIPAEAGIQGAAPRAAHETVWGRLPQPGAAQQNSNTEEQHMPSFDVVSKVDLTEVDNAINGVKRETQQRFDLKGTKAGVERSGGALTVTADNDLQLRQVHDLVHTYFARRDVDSGALVFETPQKATGDSIRQQVTIRQGIDGDLGRKIVKAVKGTKIRVQLAIQGDELRVSGKKRDDLQETIAFIKEMGIEQPLQYINFRD